MDFIPDLIHPLLSTYAFMVTFPLGALLTVIGTSLLFGGVDTRYERGTFVFSTLAFFFGVGMLATSWVIASTGMGQGAERRDAIIQAAEDAYGIELSHDEVRELDYPDSEPETDFEVFGSIVRDAKTADGFDRTEVFLIWNGSELELAESTDGEKFTSLEATR